MANQGLSPHRIKEPLEVIISGTKKKRIPPSPPSCDMCHELCNITEFLKRAILPFSQLLKSPTYFFESVILYSFTTLCLSPFLRENIYRGFTIALKTRGFLFSVQTISMLNHFPTICHLILSSGWHVWPTFWCKLFVNDFDVSPPPPFIMYHLFDRYIFVVLPPLLWCVPVYCAQFWGRGK